MRGELREEIGGLFAGVGDSLFSRRVGVAVAGRRVYSLDLRQRLAELVNALPLEFGARVLTSLRASHAGRARHTSHIDSLAIGRVHQHHAGRCGRHALQGITAAELHGVGYACTLCITLGKVDHAERHITAENRRGGLGDGGFSLVQQALPYVWLEGQILLESKTPVDAGRNVARNLRCFNGNRA